MRMAEIPERGAPGPGVHRIPAAEEALLLGDRQEQRPEVKEAALPHPGALPQEVPLEDAVQEAAQDGLREAVPELEDIIMKQDVLLPGDVAEGAAARILGKSLLAA